MSRPRRIAREVLEWVVVITVLAGGWFALHATGATIAMVKTESMEPVIYPADLVIATPGDPKVGDIVVFRPQVAGTELPKFVHRITGIKPDRSWLTQGDNNEYPDSAHTSNDDIDGIVRATVPTRFLKHPAAPMVGGAVLGALGAVVLYRRLWAVEVVADHAVTGADREPSHGNAGALNEFKEN